MENIDSVCKVRFSGGIGNQLYQLAFLYFLQREKVKVIPDFSEFTYYRFHNGLELGKILHTAYDKQIESIELSRKKWYTIFSPKLGFWLRYRFYGLKNKLVDHIRLENVNEILDIKTIGNDNRLILKGHWQRLDYVDVVKDLFFKNLNYSLLSSETDLNIMEQIKKQTSVSIHVRRGDYLKEKQYQVIRNFDYYNHAIDLIKENFQEPVFYVFSDDIKWVKENIKEENVVFVNWNLGQESFKDMLLMSLCQHNIIANSTFSWWGAYLNTNPSKIVLCPNYWMVGEKTDGRVPANWIQLEV